MGLLIDEKSIMLFCLTLMLLALRHLACLDYFPLDQNNFGQHCLKIMQDESQ